MFVAASAGIAHASFRHGNRSDAPVVRRLVGKRRGRRWWCTSGRWR